MLKSFNILRSSGKTIKGISSLLLISGLFFANPGFSGALDKVGGAIKKGAKAVGKGARKVVKGAKKAGKGAGRWVKRGGKRVWVAGKKAGKAAGRGAKRGGRWVKRGGKRVWVSGKKAGRAIGRGAKRGGRWVKRGGKRVWVSGKKAGRTIGRGAKRGGRWVIRGGKRVWVAGKKAGKAVGRGAVWAARKIKDELKTLLWVCKGRPGCITKIRLYQTYMFQLRTRVKMYRLHPSYRRLLARHFRSLRNLNSYRFGYATRQPKNNATTDCSKTYYNDRTYVRQLREGTVPRHRFKWLLHELEHYNQCKRIRGRARYALMWYGDLAVSLLRKRNLKKIHDNMPMEQRAENRAVALCRRLSECTLP